MITGLRGRRAFGALRTEGRRARAVHLDVQWRPDDVSGARRVAFAIGRNVGTAVVRNQLKRRLRAVLHELERAEAPRFPAGDYLVRVRPGAHELSFDELREETVRSLERVSGAR